MKKTLAILLGVVIAVVGIYATGVEGQPTGWLSILANDSAAAVQFRALSTYGVPVTIGAGTAAPTSANSGAPPMDGELYVTRAAGTDPVLRIYSQSATSWYDVPYEDTMNIGATWTFTADQTFNEDVTLGSDEDDLITINSPVTRNVRRIDFDFNGFYAEPTAGDDMTLDVADTNTDYLHFPGAEITPMYIRFEQAFGGAFAPETMMAGGTTAANGNVLLIDNAVILDAVDNDAVEYALFGDPDDVVLWDEDSGLDAYCEMELRFDDISDISANDFYFGWFLNAAIDDAFGYEGADTWAAFGVLDTAGDLVIQAELNGGGHGEDDSGTTIADDGTYVLRVEMSADAVAYYVDGTAVAATNAVLDADDGDTMTCRFGIRASGASVPTIEVNYIEIGLEQ